MRRVTGLTPRVLDRRGVAVDRLVLLGMTRDGFAAVPGASLNLYMGERTQYRDAAWIDDSFDRETVDYSGPWPEGLYQGLYPATYGPLQLVEDGGAVTSDIVSELSPVPWDCWETHPLTLPRDQWAQLRIRALVTSVDGSSYSAVGLGLRVSGPDDASLSAYLFYFWRDNGGTGHLSLGKYVDGAQVDPLEYFESELPIDVDWQVGDLVRAEAEWNQLRAYRNGVLIWQGVDETSPILTGGHAAIEAYRVLETDQVEATDFAAGPLRQEYVGLLADVGDVSAGLGLLEPTASPAAWTCSLVNCAPIGGADRFAGLLRHGLNAGPRTFDVYRQPVRVVHAHR